MSSKESDIVHIGNYMSSKESDIVHIGNNMSYVIYVI